MDLPKLLGLLELKVPEPLDLVLHRAAETAHLDALDGAHDLCGDADALLDCFAPAALAGRDEFAQPRCYQNADCYMFISASILEVDGTFAVNPLPTAIRTGVIHAAPSWCPRIHIASATWTRFGTTARHHSAATVIHSTSVPMSATAVSEVPLSARRESMFW